MEKGTAVFVVGHREWGKSRTLRALTGGVWQRRYVTIDDDEYFVRKMSNDDMPEELEKLVKALDPESRRRVIIALCPENDDGNLATSILNIISKKYDLNFFVLKYQYDGEGSIGEDEIKGLRIYGKVFVFDEKDMKDVYRAEKLTAFIRNL